MKVLFLSNVPAPYRVDFFYELGKYCDLTVVFEGKYATDRNEKWKSSKMKKLNCIFLNGIQCSSDSFFSLEILKIIKKKWDFIILGGYSTPTAMLAIIYLKMKKISFYLEVDGGLISNDNIVKFHIKKHFISSADGWFSSGKKTNDYLVYYGAKKEKCYIYPFTSITSNDLINNFIGDNKQVNNVRKYFVEKGTDIDIYYQQLYNLREMQIIYARSYLSIYEKKMILAVGQFIYRKGFDMLINIADRLSNDVGIYIIGGKPTKEYLDLKKNNKLNNIHFVDFLSKEDLDYYYKAADIFVLPTREDIWGLVINEAMSHGLPVITTNQCIAGLELIENGKNGYIVEVNQQELLNKIKNVLGSDSIKMGINGLEKIKNYTIEEMALRHIDLINEIFNERNEK